jgi:hypothetical protein
VDGGEQKTTSLSSEGAMKFQVSHARAVTGNNIRVKVEGESKEEIIRVKIDLDGFSLADDDIEPASESYENDFVNAGDGGPLMDHTLVVTATTSDNSSHSATTNWTDTI